MESRGITMIVNKKGTKGDAKEAEKETKSKDSTSTFSKIISICTLIIACVTGIFTILNNLKLREFDMYNYNLESFVKYDLVYTINVNEEKKATLLINENGVIQEIEAPTIEISPQIGGIKKAYAVYYHNNNCWGMESFEEVSFKIDEYNASDLKYQLEKYSLDYEATQNDNWYGTIYIIVQDYNNKYSYNMLVFKMGKDNQLVDFKVYDELQSKMLCQSENFKVTNQYECEKMGEFNNLISEIEAADKEEN